MLIAWRDGRTQICVPGLSEAARLVQNPDGGDLKGTNTDIPRNQKAQKHREKKAQGRREALVMRCPLQLRRSTCDSYVAL